MPIEDGDYLPPSRLSRVRDIAMDAFGDFDDALRGASVRGVMGAVNLGYGAGFHDGEANLAKLIRIASGLNPSATPAEILDEIVANYHKRHLIEEPF